MYGLIWKDFLVLRKTLRLYVLFLLGYLGMALLGIFDLTFVTTFCVVILMILPISAFSERDDASGQLFRADDGHQRNAAAVGVLHLFLHPGLIGVDLGRNVRVAHGAQQRQHGGLLRLAEIREQHARRAVQFGGEEAEARHHVVDAVRAERDADARHVGHSEDAREIVVTAAARNRADGEVEGLDLEDRH